MGPEPLPLTIGTRLGPYQTLALLGSGGMGDVHRARDTRLDRIVAIKVLKAQASTDPTRHQRFEREAKIVSQLNHPHICALFDVGQHEGIDYLVMEYLEGETLAERLKGPRNRPLSLNEALSLAIQIANALDAAHRRGIVHRDLKPSNVMLTKAGAKLLDFGIAKAMEADRAGGPDGAGGDVTGTDLQATLTDDGALLGTVQSHGPGAIGRARGRHPQRHLCFRRSAIRDVDGQAGIRRREPVEGHRRGARSRSPTGRHSAASDAARHDTHRSEVSSEGSRNSAGSRRAIWPTS